MAMPAADIDPTLFREAMARLGAAVTILTTRGPEGDVGMTASAVCSVTDTPPTVLVCINRAGSQYETFKSTGFICINVLAHEHEELSPIFAGVGDLPMEQRFARGEWIRLATGAPALRTAAASLDCKVTQSVDVGTHTVFFCEVQAIHLGPAGSGLVYHGRAYHQILHRFG